MNEDWRARARCQLIGSPGLNALFFPIAGQPVTLIAAKQICAECPVVEECLVYAEANNIEEGVWGGLSEEERRYRRRKAS